MADKVKELLEEYKSDLEYELEIDEVITSPIEKMLYIAIKRAQYLSLIGDPLMNYQLDINPQPEIKIDKKSYRPDFLLTMSQAVKIENIQYVRSYECYIECDGHNYHERTKAQAKNDRTKDRDFMKEGLQLIRYTGSEIYNDAFSCAMEIENFMFKNLEQQSLRKLY